MKTKAIIGRALLLTSPGLVPEAEHSALDSAGPQAAAIESAWWVYFVVSCVVYVAVMAWMLVAVTRKRDPDDFQTPQAADTKSERSMTRTVIGLVAVTTIILFGLLIDDFVTSRRLQALEVTKPLSVRITGHQWWWQVEYLDEPPSRNMKTANELHLPVGRAVRLELQSHDVIHSLSIPNLHGKRDLIPGYPTETHLQADREGTYWGVCAEFCGYQHANMKLLVVAESPAKFETWLESQRESAPDPETNNQRRGRELFLGTTCVMCHTVRGTSAGSEFGPELTHIASRQRLAAGTLPNVRGHLLGWITDPHGIKPGVRMPSHSFSASDLQCLGDYLESLH